MISMMGAPHWTGTPATWTILIVLGRLATALPTSNSTAFDWSNTKYLLAFGDSYTYVQGTQGHQNYSFIGDYLPGNFSFTSEELLSNQIVQNQTSTAEGGPNWVEYLTGCGLSPGLTDPQTCDRQLWDFAFAGSDISEQYLALHHPYTVPLVNQTQQFSLYAAPALAPLLTASQTLVAVWIGINDINDSASFTNLTSFAAFYSTLHDALFASLTADVLPHGYSSYLFLNLPPLDRTPANLLRAESARKPNASMIAAFDESLSRHAADFAAANDGVEALVFDANGFLNGVLDDAASYGIKNTTGYCAAYDQPFINETPDAYGCRPLNEYFWFNSGHTTSRVHEILAGEVGRFLEGASAMGERFGRRRR